MSALITRGEARQIVRAMLAKAGDSTAEAYARIRNGAMAGFATVQTFEETVLPAETEKTRAAAALAMAAIPGRAATVQPAAIPTMSTRSSRRRTPGPGASTVPSPDAASQSPTPLDGAGV
jgi:hypothetical protein